MCIIVCILQQGQERVETNNEQRLPLKKRHYHISTAAAILQSTNCLPGSPQADSMVTAVDCTKKALERTTAQDKDKLLSTSSVGVAGKNQGKPTADKPVIMRDKGGCGSGSVGGSTSHVNSCEVKSKPIVDLPRNSIDEAIEACITRYTATSPPVENSTLSVHSVIATPKKRHRMETAAAAAGMMGKSLCTSVNKSKESGVAEGGATSNNKLSGVAVTSPPPSKRTVSRSASANSGTVVAVLSDSSATPDIIKTFMAPDSSGIVSSEAIADSTTGSPALKVSSSVGKVTSCCKVSPPVNKMASQANKATSPTSKTFVSLSKSSSPVSKPSTVTTSKVSSPTKVTASNSKVSSSPVKQTSPVSKVSMSSPSKGTTFVPTSATKVSSTSGSKVISPSNKITSPLSKSLVPGSKAATPKALAVSSKISLFPSTVVTVSAASVTTTTTTAATMAATAVVTAATTAITTVSASTVGEMISSRLTVMPAQHNLRLKRANGASERDESHLRRSGVGKKKKLIRDIRVHVTKLSPTDFLLKKAVGTVKQRVRRRKAINRTGFPIKKKKKKLCISNGDMKPLKCPNSAPVPTHLSTPVINIDVKKSLADDSTTKTPSQSSGGKEILNRAETKRPHGFCRKDRSNRISESRPKDREVEKEDRLRGELEKKPAETVSREPRQTVNGKRDAIKLPNEDISLKEKREPVESKSGEDNDGNPSKTEDSVGVVGGDAQCSQAKESHASSKQNKGSVVDYSQDYSKLMESCSLTVPGTDLGLPVASVQACDTGDKDSKARNKRKRDSSKDDYPLPLGSKRMKKCRDEYMDQDDR